VSGYPAVLDCEGKARAGGPFLNLTSQQRVLRAFALCEQGQRLACNIGLEMRAFLMRLEGGLIAEQFVEQELRGIVLAARDQEQLYARLALRLRQEVVENGGHLVRLALLGLPLRDDEKAAAVDGFADRFLRCVLIPASGSLLLRL